MLDSVSDCLLLFHHLLKHCDLLQPAFILLLLHPVDLVLVEVELEESLLSGCMLCQEVIALLDLELLFLEFFDYAFQLIDVLENKLFVV